MSAEDDSTQPDGMDGTGAPDASNPYAPPLAPLEVLPREALEAQFPDASKGKRFANLIIDRIAIYGFAIVLGVIGGVLEEMGIVSGWLNWLNNVSRIEDILFTAAVSVVYYISIESLSGRTLGKLITGTKVLAVDGTRPGFLQMLGRTLARVVPFEPLSFLGEGRWHDRWSGTRVVDLRDKAGRDAMSRLSPQLARLYRR